MKSDREHATRHRDHVGRPEIGAAWSKRSEKCRVTSPSPLTLPPHSISRSWRTCSTRKVTKDHPSCVAAVRMVEAADPKPTRLEQAGLREQEQSSASTSCRQRKTRPGRRRPHAKPATAPRSGTGRTRTPASQWPSPVGRLRIRACAIARTNEYADCRRNPAYLNGERTTASLSRFGDRHGPVRSQKISLMNTVRNDAWKVAADTGFGLIIETAEIA
ncbi:hypothetical protein ACVWY5_001415 [Bradyrhizobium sp. USDA 3256]